MAARVASTLVTLHLRQAPRDIRSLFVVRNFEEYDPFAWLADLQSCAVIGIPHITHPRNPPHTFHTYLMRRPDTTRWLSHWHAVLAVFLSGSTTGYWRGRVLHSRRIERVHWCLTSTCGCARGRR